MPHAQPATLTGEPLPVVELIDLGRNAAAKMAAQHLARRANAAGEITVTAAELAADGLVPNDRRGREILALLIDRAVVVEHQAPSRGGVHHLRFVRGHWAPAAVRVTDQADALDQPDQGPTPPAPRIDTPSTIPFPAAAAGREPPPSPRREYQNPPATYDRDSRNPPATSARKPPATYDRAEIHQPATPAAAATSATTCCTRPPIGAPLATNGSQSKNQSNQSHTPMDQRSLERRPPATFDYLPAAPAGRPGQPVTMAETLADTAALIAAALPSTLDQRRARDAHRDRMQAELDQLCAAVEAQPTHPSLCGHIADAWAKAGPPGRALIDEAWAATRRAVADGRAANPGAYLRKCLANRGVIIPTRPPQPR